jgi:hypothetical protein
VRSHKHFVWTVGICLTLAAAFYPARADAQWRYPGYYVQRDLTALRLLVKPSDAQVYVDGYYAGIVDDFDGVFQRLHVAPGPHRIEIQAPGYVPTMFDVRADPDHTTTLTGELKPM